MTTKTKIKTLKFLVRIIIEEDPPAGYHAYAPALKGLHAGGDTATEALNNAKKTAKDFLEIMIEDGTPIPLSILAADTTRKLPAKKGAQDEEITINLS